VHSRTIEYNYAAFDVYVYSSTPPVLILFFRVVQALKNIYSNLGRIEEKYEDRWKRGYDVQSNQGSQVAVATEGEEMLADSDLLSCSMKRQMTTSGDLGSR